MYSNIPGMYIYVNHFVNAGPSRKQGSMVLLVMLTVLCADFDGEDGVRCRLSGIVRAGCLVYGDGCTGLDSLAFLL